MILTVLGSGAKLDKEAASAPSLPVSPDNKTASEWTHDFCDAFLGNSFEHVAAQLLKKQGSDPAPWSLNLKGNSLTESSMEHLLQLLGIRSLTALSLEWNSLGFPETLADALCRNTSLIKYVCVCV